MKMMSQVTIRQRHYLRPHAALQQTESAVLAVAGRGDQLDVRVGDGGVEGLAEEGWLAHGHLAARADVQQTVAHLEGEGLEVVGGGLLVPEELGVVHLELRVQPVARHVHPHLLAGRLPLLAPRCSNVSTLQYKFVIKLRIKEKC